MTHIEDELLVGDEETRQPRLFPAPSGGRWTVPVATVPDRPLAATSSLALAAHWFDQELTRLGMAANTRKTYVKAVRLLARYLGPSKPLSQIIPDDLHRFQAWVEQRARSPKTAEVKLTAVRRFFLALYEARILPANVAADMYPTKAQTPLPVVLHQAQAERIRRIVAEKAARLDEPDVRPALLVTLLLDMGLRLGEVQRLNFDDIDVSNPLRPVVHVRYSEQRHRAKQRALLAPPALSEVLRRYVQHHPLPPGEKRLLPYSRRILQYWIVRVGEEAQLHRPLSPSMLRWTFAVEQFKAGVDPETLRQRLGLAPRGWRDVEVKLKLLARRPI